ncbi:MAG: hypothetical protein GY710_25755 [Desulfobacteraceae bacterium]|nr:hypothetical protein [Desulfobacteraceae bacterium]
MVYKRLFEEFIQNIIKKYSKTLNAKFHNVDSRKVNILSDILEKIKNEQKHTIQENNARIYLKNIIKCVLIIRGSKTHTRSATVTLSVLHKSKYISIKNLISAEIHKEKIEYQDIHTFAYPNLTLNDLQESGFAKSVQKTFIHNEAIDDSLTKHFYISYAVHNPKHYAKLLFSDAPHVSLILSAKQPANRYTTLELCISFHPWNLAEFNSQKPWNKPIDGGARYHYHKNNNSEAHLLDMEEGVISMPELYTRTYEISASIYRYLFNTISEETSISPGVDSTENKWEKAFHGTRFNCHAFALSYLQLAGIYDSFFTDKGFNKRFPSSTTRGFQFSSWRLANGNRNLVFKNKVNPIRKYSEKYPESYMKICGFYIQNGRCAKAGAMLLRDYAYNTRMHSRNHVESIRYVLEEYQATKVKTISALLDIINEEIDTLKLPTGSLARRYAFITKIPKIALALKGISTEEYNRQISGYPNIKDDRQEKFSKINQQKNTCILACDRSESEIRYKKSKYNNILLNCDRSDSEISYKKSISSKKSFNNPIFLSCSMSDLESDH